MAKSKLPEGYSDENETARKLRKSTRTLRKWRQLRIGPAWTEMGKTIIYRDGAILEYLKANEQQPVRERSAARRRAA